MRLVVGHLGGENMGLLPKTIAGPDGCILKSANVEGKDLVVNVTNTVVSIDYLSVYDRWIGTLEGGFTDGSANETGVAQYEESKV